jgi:hypothetical protein
MTMKTNKSLRAKLAVGLAIVVMVLANMACDENPCGNGSACGITAPVTSAEQAIIDAVAPEQQNTLSGGN